MCDVDRAMAVDRRKRKAPGGDEAPDAPAAACHKKVDITPTVEPRLVLERDVLLLDHDYRARFPAPPPPIPTVTHLDISLGGDGAAAYGGGGTLTLPAGDARVYTNAPCTVPLTDPNDGLPLTAAHGVAITNNLLTAGLRLYVLGRGRGGLRFALALAAAAGVRVLGPAQADGTVVELTLQGSTFAPHSVALVEGQRIAYGKVVGVPAAGALSLRSPVRMLQSNPTGHGRLRLAASAARISLHANPWPQADGDADVLGQALVDNARDGWVQGTTAGAAIWLSLGLVLADGTMLENGDLLKFLPTAQGRISVGFEWENNDLLLERRHDDDAERRERDWEGVPSKAIVFESAAAAHRGFKIDTEVTNERHPVSYGEFVLGPAYDHAELEGQLSELKRAIDTVSLHRLVLVRTPRDIQSREPGRFADVWMPAGHRVALWNRDGRWGGTAQATFAVPLWMLPTFLANLGGGEGQRAKAAAEGAAAGFANDLGANPNREATDLVIGLIAACQYYIEIYRGRAEIRDDDGPKVAATVMFRTDFHAMYGLLTNGDQRRAFQAWIAAHAHRADRLLPNGYSRGGGQREAHGPTIGDWLDSVVNPHDGHGKDRMSPPPGLTRHHVPTPIPYGMGKLGADGTTHTVIAECRAIPGNCAGFNAFVAAVFRSAENFLLGGARTWERNRDWGWGPAGYAPPRGRPARRDGTELPDRP